MVFAGSRSRSGEEMFFTVKPSVIRQKFEFTRVKVLGSPVWWVNDERSILIDLIDKIGPGIRKTSRAMTQRVFLAVLISACSACAALAHTSEDLSQWNNFKTLEIIGSNWQTAQTDYPIQYTLHKGLGAYSGSNIYL